jgi:DNA adenine methylase
MYYKPPFPWFGGKSRVSDIIWRAFGDVDNYVEPFFGSGAVLFGRPDHHKRRAETVNDKDHWIANFWRAVQAAPDEVAKWADNPVNECVPAGTMVSTPSGDIPIERIKPGMLVYGYANGKILPSRVMATTKKESSEFYEIGPLSVTGNHPIWTKEMGYVKAEDLTDGLHIGVYTPVDKDDLIMLYCLHGKQHTQMGNIYSNRSEGQSDSLCRCDLSGETALQRTSFASYEGGQNSPGLLDSLFGSCGLSPRLSGSGNRLRGRLAGCGEALDSRLSSVFGLGKSYRRGRRNARVYSIGRGKAKTLRISQGHSLCSWPNTSDEGKASFGGGERKNPGNEYRAHYASIAEIKGVCGPKGKTTIRRTPKKTVRYSFGEDTIRRTQKKYLPGDHRQKARCLHRNGTGISVNQRACATPGGNERVCKSGNSEGMPLQRKSLPLPVAVHNLQTETGNYFAENILVHNCDLTARHIHLVKHVSPELERRIMADPEYHDAKAAGWWVWGICCWIGSGWCSGNGPWSEDDGQLVHLGDAGRGVNRQLIHLGNAGQGVNRKRIHLGAGRGVNRKRIDLGFKGVANKERLENLVCYIQTLSDRLRYVRVCAGDWQRVVTDGALSYGSTIGIFFDPPYTDDGRASDLYNHDTDGDSIPAAVLQWCKDHGKNKKLRIALCGYDGEHNDLERHGWSVYAWKASRAYGSGNNGGSANNTNRHNERIWFSPACLPVVQPSLLFASGGY